MASEFKSVRLDEGGDYSRITPSKAAKLIEAGTAELVTKAADGTPKRLRSLQPVAIGDLPRFQNTAAAYDDVVSRSDRQGRLRNAKESYFTPGLGWALKGCDLRRLGESGSTPNIDVLFPDDERITPAEVPVLGAAA